LDFAARAKAERLRAEAEAARSAVLTSFGHDLRTPLATILGAASSLKELDAQLPPAARADLLSAIEEEAARLNAHVSNLMQLSRLELVPPPRRDWVDVNDLVTAAATRARRAVKDADFQVDLSDLPMIRSDGGLIEQAVFNLIDNALAHGRGRVQIMTADTSASLSIRIADQGAGLPGVLAEWLARPELRPAMGQSGLGLAVAKGIARHLGGNLTWANGVFSLELAKNP
jgi:two-component system sensor histidine kinase KdpD